MITFAATALFGKLSTDVVTALITSEFRIVACTDLCAGILNMRYPLLFFQFL